ncbi:hypothetical protein ACFWWC_47695 [Streptomyces sp. NPDC058642]|uniref:hypothetical protein n=1 Tax=Streptomyces sp. NPDC058642 TaxID=3346572 RepID=UPI00364986E0
MEEVDHALTIPRLVAGEPMRAVPVNDPALPAGWAAQPNWDGYRALAGRWADGCS